MKSPSARRLRRSSSKPVVAIDIDDVLAHHAHLLTNFIADHFQVKITLEDATRGFIKTVQDQIRVADEEVISAVDRFLQTDAFYPEPIRGAVGAVGKLKRRYHLVVISSRPQSARERTERWVGQYFPGMFERLMFVGAPRWGHGNSLSKAEAIEGHAVEILIDDRPDHCQTATRLGARAILFGEYPWNQTGAEPGIERALDWNEVEELLL